VWRFLNTLSSFDFELPQGLNDDYLPLYGGKVWINSDNGERLSIPYGGRSRVRRPRYGADHSAGAAYDTEKAFDTMFAGEPYIMQLGPGSKEGWRYGDPCPLYHPRLTASAAVAHSTLRKTAMTIWLLQLVSPILAHICDGTSVSTTFSLWHNLAEPSL
jgi:hypothetical protein